MSALARAESRSLRALRERDLETVIAIERQAYDFPWTRGNFVDSLHAGYAMQVLLTPADGLAGYFVAMHGVEELHLLNLTVAPALQGRGHARHMLDALCALAQAQRSLQLWLEVRQSNARARALYERYGFSDVGLRRGYYPAVDRGREDAVVMSLPIPRARAGGGNGLG